jgi:hypothetical protein
MDPTGAKGRSLMIHFFHSFFGVNLWRAAGISIAVSCLSSPAAQAQNYPVNGVWVEADDHTPGSKGGACFILKVLGLDSILDGSLPTVLIFSDGKRTEIRAGFHAQQSIRSIRSMADGSFRVEELPSGRTKWLPWSWSKRRSYSLRIVDLVTIEVESGQSTTRFVKCSSKNSLL